MRTLLGRWLLGTFVAVSASFAAAPVIQRSDTVGVELGRSLEYRVVAVGDVQSYAAQGLPSGVTLNASTGLVHGTPTESGRFSTTVTARNAEGASSMTLTIAVVPPDAAPLIYAPLIFDAYASSQPGGDSFSCTLKATGSPSGFEATDALPEHWSLQSATISGRTDKPGTYLLGIAATNGQGIGSAAITVRVHPACTELLQTTGELRPGDTFTVTLRFNRPMSFSGSAPYLEFHTYPEGPTRRIPYVSGNGTSVFQFAYTVTAADAPGDILLYTAIQPAAAGGVTGLEDQDGLNLGSTLPVTGPYTPAARIVSAPVAPTPAPAATDATVTTTVTNATATEPPAASSSTAPAAGTATQTPPAATGGTAATTVVPEQSPTPTGSTAVAVNGPRLVNLSARAAVAAGFVVSGSAPKRMLLRAVGPALSEFGVTQVVSNPRLQVYDASGKVVLENEDWAGSEVTSVGTRVGAFGLQAGSRDAALAVTLPPGSYSMHVVPASGSGVALAEIYDADTGTGAPLVNISTRAYVDAGEGSLVAGFVVSGSSPKRVLVRGIGPGLAPYGVGGTLPDPVVRVYQNSNVVAENDNWSSAADVAAASSAVGAFPLASGSADSAVVVSLPPGAYSAVVSPAGGRGGAGLVEVYELP